MINTTMQISQPAGFGMPMSPRDRVASVRVLPVSTGVVCLPTVGAIAPATGIQGTAVRGYRLAIDAVAVKGAFPGTSAWSPPI
jgi:hypothetical protein